MRDPSLIQADLDAAYVARRSALDAASYSLDTGQGRQQVQRAELTQINATIRELESELQGAVEDASGFGSVGIAGLRRT